MITYNKLVRDKIPQIIRDKGKECEVLQLNENSYVEMLNAKLDEEINEYKNAGGDKEVVEELADLVEVVYSILKQNGISIEEFEKVRLQKREERGGFDERQLLVKVWEKSQ
ncbi:nucleoside triphosphate pyrophosphohydrolase [Brevibacillus choshinensis]|uniref:nucleoside triphosphate pyrophosphohydrolase n=1 Tax=Brevibacillus choshinensis TaxID=54911 RepID=UPI002E20F2BE|nr:nucleoside triphosphate pyrophosphohydrolase [Brevibacillus choshinensis]